MKSMKVVMSVSGAVVAVITAFFFGMVAAALPVAGNMPLSMKGDAVEQSESAPANSMVMTDTCSLSYAAPNCAIVGQARNH